MLTGQLVVLRARLPSDVPMLHEQLHDDVRAWVRADGRPWRPRAATDSPYAVPEPGRTDAAVFTVVRRDDGALAGDAVLWEIDTHNRGAHIGLSLLSAHRGQGLGRDVLQVLCRYAFDILGLHRLQVETLGDNAAMIGAARAAGFVVEGTRREAAWVDGRFHDETWLGLLAADWRSRR
jgi:RimJ/RimL family protein N-acetyltransferase